MKKRGNAGPESVKCQGGIISQRTAFIACPFSPAWGRFRKVISAFDLFYVNICLGIDGEPDVSEDK